MIEHSHPPQFVTRILFKALSDVVPTERYNKKNGQRPASALLLAHYARR